VASGHQQINNGVIPSSSEKLLNEPIELLEANNDKWMDTGTKAKAEGLNTELETVGAVHRSKDTSRKSKVK
jgi:hypothetical protein